MKKLLLALLILSSGLVAYAQGKSPEAKATARVNKLSNKLDLSEEQKSQIHELFMAQANKEKISREEIKSMSQEERSAFKESRKAQRAEFEAQLSTILTTEQFEKLQANKKEGKKRRKKQGKKNKGKKDMNASIQKKVNHLSDALELSAEQKSQVTTLLKEQQNTRINKAAKKDWTPENRAANKENRKALKADMDAKMKQILTDEQYATFQTLQEGRREKGRKRGSLRRGKQ